MTADPPTPDPKNPLVVLPELCFRCQRRIVKRCHLNPWDPWRAHIVVAQLLLFTWVASEDGIHTRSEGDSNNLSLILAELGCLGCARRPLFGDAILPLLAKGLSHAADVQKGKVRDELYPVWDRVPGHWEKKAAEGEGGSE